MRTLRTCACLIALALAAVTAQAESDDEGHLRWTPLPDLPDPLGVAGPFVGVQGPAGRAGDPVAIVAGGANFPVETGQDLWDVPKVWHDDAWVLVPGENGALAWRTGFTLDRPVGYGAAVGTPHGVVCLGGTDGREVFDTCFLLAWDRDTEELAQTPLPSLPAPSVYGGAALIGNTVYCIGGQTGLDLASATRNAWSLDLSFLDDPAAGQAAWEPVAPWPGAARAFAVVTAQHDGFAESLYVISGRRAGTPDDPTIPGLAATDDIFVLHDAWALRPGGAWRRVADVPRGVMAGTAVPLGPSHLFVVAGADGTLMTDAATLRDAHPGFPRRALAYHTITDTWIDAGETPSNQVTTTAVRYGDDALLVSGEVRPRVRSRSAWRIEPVVEPTRFGAVNMVVLVVYLLAMVAVGAWFARRQRGTDDYFRGGQRVPWIVAGCSIFATMLSSITYMAIPAKAFAQDWVYLLGNFMILAVAPIAVYLALPFYRRLDATSAYEYFEKRFNRAVRLFGSASFALFHIFRMGIVMSLAGLALATITPLTAGQCVVVMGVLSIIYCALGGLEAVVWTDTIQTVVLLGGALLCVGVLLLGAEGGATAALATAANDGKLHMANVDFGAASYTTMALWVVILGGIGQNVSSYTADQAVVQRYVATSDQGRAARAIWTNALLAIPASLLFYGLGTALYVHYKTHPEHLDPFAATDQVLPLFIARELPAGVAGLLVAGIFAAAQSTISTSMNSTATTIVTDFVRPLGAVRSERGLLRTARVLTVALGAAGTLLGLLFVSPDIRSLFDAFIKVIGLFMGVLGGLFCLGVLTRRANGPGALVGAIAGASIMGLLPVFTAVSGYLYAVIGIVTCGVIGYAASLVLPGQEAPDGLTVYGLRSRN